MNANDPRSRLLAAQQPQTQPSQLPSQPVPAASSSTSTSASKKGAILLGGEDDMDVDEAAPLMDESQRSYDVSHKATTTTTTASAAVAVPRHHPIHHHEHGKDHQQYELIAQIITPSPYPQHTTGPTSSRFRNALSRVNTNPTVDVEAWQAIMTEVHSCYRNILNIHAVDADTQAKLDWAESCHGALLKHFPYASTYLVSVAEMLMAQSARIGEPDGPMVDYGHEPTHRSIRCEMKLERILSNALDVSWQQQQSSETGEENNIPDNNNSNNSHPEYTTTHNPKEEDGAGADGITTTNHTGAAAADDASTTTASAMMVRGMCTWVVELWLLYIRKCARDAQRVVLQKLTWSMEERTRYVRDQTLKAYEHALNNGAAFAINNHLFWKHYISYVRSWPTITTTATAGSDNASSTTDFTTNVDHALVQQQMLQLRSVFQRLVTFPMTGLDQLWQEYEALERGQNELLAQALLAEYAPKYQHARTVYLERNRVYSLADLQLGQRLATAPAAPTDEDYGSKLQEEVQLLKVWKIRASYERTNPERLTPPELTVRIRHAYREMACVLTRHVEVWHMWSMWELCGKATSDGKVVAVSAATAKALAVLRLGQSHIPDSTLLAYAQASIMEQYHKAEPWQCLAVLEKFLDSCPNTLAFVLYQKLVRRYKGKEEARVVFARARRVLVDASIKNKLDGDRRKAAQSAESDVVETVEPEPSAASGENDSLLRKKRSIMVTNRLDPSVGLVNSSSTTAATQHLRRENDDPSGDHNDAPPSMISSGQVTWHLYASHAEMEQHVNHEPAVAARVYELGLRKHPAFLTKPAYVRRYAQLLLELGDVTNLRALLTRAVKACEAQDQRDATGVLWDLSLRLESIMTGNDPSSMSVIAGIEKRRWEAFMGTDAEDVATGGRAGVDDTALIGAQKSSIAEQLVRTEGYDVSSRIVNGLCRTIDLLAVMGLWGSDEQDLSRGRRRLKPISEAEKDEDIPGGKSDASYQNRLSLQGPFATGISAEYAAEGVGTGSAKILSARERLQQSAGAAVAGAPGQTTAIMLAIQQSPEWLRPLLLLLPASRLRLPIVAKPPPHLTEMALSAMRQNTLPAERPDDAERGGVKKRKIGDANADSSDEESSAKEGGYSSQFRARQRARQLNGTANH